MPAGEIEDSGMRLCGALGSEDELQQWLESFFEDNGWTAIREVSPRNSNCRADLIVNHDDYGWYGIETKYIRGACGGSVADAHHKITQKYRGQKYIGHRIDCWLVCPYFWCYGPDDYKSSTQRTRADLISGMFSRHGIGYINLDKSRLLLDFADSRMYAKVPVGGENLGKHAKAVDVDRIHDRVHRMCQQYPYD